MSQTTNIQEVKKQIFDMINELKQLSIKCELLAQGQIAESKEKQVKCLKCHDTKMLHIEGSGWVDQKCLVCA